MPSDQRSNERALLVINGYELEVLMEILAAVQERVPGIESKLGAPEHGQAWGTLLKKIADCVGPNGEVTSPGGSERLH